MAGEQLCLPCAVKAGGVAGALAVLTLGVGRVPAVQRFAGRLGTWLGETRLGQWAKAAAGELAVAARRLRVRVSGVPQGLTRAQFRELSTRVRAKSLEMGYGDDIVVQGSRVSGRAKPTSDVDLGMRVSDDEFDRITRQSFGTPNSPSAKERTMLHAIRTGKIQAGEAGLSGFRKELAEQFGMRVDVSVIRRGGPFDQNPTLPLRPGR